MHVILRIALKHDYITEKCFLPQFIALIRTKTAWNLSIYCLVFARVQIHASMIEKKKGLHLIEQLSVDVA